MLPTTTTRKYLVPTVLGASSLRIPAAIVVAAVIVIIIVAEGAAAAFRPEIAPAVVAAALLFLAVLLGGPEEPKGLSAHRLVVVGGGVDLLFRGGVDSVRRGVFLVAVLRLLLEQEPEVFSLGLGLVFLGDGPEVELLCIPVQRSQRFIRCSWVPLRCRLRTLQDGVAGRSREGEEEGEEEEEESPKELESEEEEIAMATGAGGMGFSALLALGGRRSLL